MQISVQDLKARMDAGDDTYVLVDVREPHERDEFNIGGTHIPVGQIAAQLDELRALADKEIIVYCRSGNRSGMIQGFLKQQGFEQVTNLSGGMLAWLKEIEDLA